MTSLRNDVAKLAKDNPDGIREHLVPVLKEGASKPNPRPLLKALEGAYKRLGFPIKDKYGDSPFDFMEDALMDGLDRDLETIIDRYLNKKGLKRYTTKGTDSTWDGYTSQRDTRWETHYTAEMDYPSTVEGAVDLRFDLNKMLDRFSKSEWSGKDQQRLRKALADRTVQKEFVKFLASVVANLGYNPEGLPYKIDQQVEEYVWDHSHETVDSDDEDEYEIGISPRFRADIHMTSITITLKAPSVLQIRVLANAKVEVLWPSDPRYDDYM